LKSHTHVFLVDVATRKIFRSPVFTSSKNKEDKFIYSGWKKFVKENTLRFRDKVIFNAFKGDNTIEIEIVRRSQAC
jgi:hypothetical protein